MPDLILPYFKVGFPSSYKWAIGLTLEKDRDFSNFKRVYLSLSLFATLELGIRYKNAYDL